MKVDENKLNEQEPERAREQARGLKRPGGRGDNGTCSIDLSSSLFVNIFLFAGLPSRWWTGPND